MLIIIAILLGIIASTLLLGAHATLIAFGVIGASIPISLLVMVLVQKFGATNVLAIVVPWLLGVGLFVVHTLS